MGAIAAALVLAAGLMLWKGLTPESVEAPLPAAEFEIPAGAPVVGPTGDEPVDVGGDTMTAADMGPDTLFIPQLGVYMPVEADDSFVPSKYEGFDTLKVPSDATHAVRFAGGAPMYGGQSGVTMIASHVSTSTGWGALRYLYQLTGGEMIYTKDSAGQLQSWQMTAMRVEDHTAFPQDYWSAEGARQLVITTCGGAVNAQRLFTQNIFAIAVPVDPLPKTAEQLLSEEVVTHLGDIAVRKHAEATAAAEQARLEAEAAAAADDASEDEEAAE
ncbi:Sortase family protein [Plantibacter flavus]|uniref:Sortase family protein n=1 Tax=Plantibacter flavus TaxID=150123 RepID=A0A3N2BLP9_9MICO|nr:class F sortase [Plantibacter flavus]ROR76092.1 sortase family protein [Plantibacter flavus]SMG48635.1 Sortase family protein [Plantibacter flavus]